MKKVLLVLCLIVASNFGYAQQTIGDVTMPGSATFSGEELVLNGAGLREKMWFDLYVGGLYVKSKSKNADAIINADEPMAMKLHIISKLVSQEKMVGAVNDGFESSSHGTATAAEQAQFTACFKDEIKSGNIFDIVYANGKVTVYKDGAEKGSVAGLEFKKALFAIWLGKKPADKDLKSGMLGN